MSSDKNNYNEQALSVINNIDFSMIIDKLVSQMKWKRAHALEICEMYRRFLLLQKKYGQSFQLVPSVDIDDFWHTHILDTKKYHQDCQEIFGYYLHHYQYFGMDGKSTKSDTEKSYSKTRDLYVLEFKEDIYEIRSVFAQVISFIKMLIKK